jgi:hypothetical protein
MADFAGLRQRPPAGMQVLQADNELHLYNKKQRRTYIVREDNGVFTMTERTTDFGEHFIMSTDSMHRVLQCLGYGKK